MLRNLLNEVMGSKSLRGLMAALLQAPAYVVVNGRKTVAGNLLGSFHLPSAFLSAAEQLPHQVVMEKVGVPYTTHL